jgi:hypothetical protein
MMPRYFFHQMTRQGIISDLEGFEFPDIEQARLEAIQDARHLMADAIRRGLDISSRIFHICDEGGDAVAVVTFQEAIISEE